ncbi:translation initiation factor IF-3 [Xenococcus sp. PCC 7305]|uniref:translation initiation factor IF-3 n=1 Tax=Xenococcus sp. PCC 7305 TaxID=102125 RepID=UPI0002AC323A|nr:translation initiation factor IF-3 [Xenococcus sp. PCC 7305]ELS02953.1 translation initiation factor IF-3 [Xenococcus sp. PCC 7305]
MKRVKRNKFIKQLHQKERHKINEKIQAQQVRVIDENGEQVGIESLDQALTLAKEKNLDLVEIAPKANPPVCKLIDYGKYKYQLQKKESDAKKNQRDNAVKELKIGYSTDVGDLKTKLRHARGFLSHGNKVKFSMRFRGREKAFIHLGKTKLEGIVAQLEDVAKVYELNLRSRSQMHITLIPD